MPSAKNFLGLLEKLQSADITVHQNRCAVVRNRNATCMKCAEVCTSGCISYNDNELIISPEKCIGCGTCATVCPTCALEAHRPNDAELLHRCIQAMRAADGEVVIACEQIVNAAEGLLDLEKVVSVTCLGRVEESLLVTLAVAGAKHVSLVEGKCASCEHATGFHMAEQVRDTANTLLETWNSDTRVDLVKKFPHQVRLEGKSSFDAGKRRFFAEMGSEAKAAAGTTADYAVKETLGIEEKPESRFQKVMEDGTLPHFIPARHFFPAAVSSKYILRLSCSPSTRLTNPFSSTERITFDVCDGLIALIAAISAAERLPPESEQSSIASFMQTRCTFWKSASKVWIAR